jgi:hypothetical protein
MLKKTTIGCLLALFIVIGCKKEIGSDIVSTSGTSNFNVATHGVKDTLGRWFGTYSPKFSDPDAPPDTVSENVLIKNGQAAVPYDKDNLNTSIGYFLPTDQSLAGDSIAFKAAVKDDINIVQMDIMGTQNIASAEYVKGANNTGTITMAVGNTIQSKQVSAIDFTSFKAIGLVLKGDHAFFYVSNKLMLSFAYSSNDRVGSIKTLSIGNNYHQYKLSPPANGNIGCDYVRLYNSYSKSLLMKEDFNIDGRSNTIFTK